MIDKYTNPFRIMSYNEGKIFTKKEYNILKKQAKLERDRIKIEYNLNEDSYYSKKVIEYVINNTEYKELSPLKKEIMLANAIIPDDNKIIDILTENGFTKEHIQTIIKFRSILKKLLLNKTYLTEELNEQINIYKNVVSKLIEIFYNNFYTNNSTIILNRLCELLVTKPQLFDSLSNTKSKKLTK